MKIQVNLKHVVLLLGLSIFIGCNAQRESSVQNQAEQDLVELRNWMGNKFDKAENATADERAELRKEFSSLTDRVENGLENLAEESKEEYKQLKNRYNEWEAKQEWQANMPLDTEKQSEWTNRLMGSYQDINSINGEQLPEAYQAFIKNVWNTHSNWSPKNWEYAQNVFNRLKGRKDQGASSLSTEDRTKIEALEVEFGTLKTGQDVEELLKE